jgi:hypothetical protein
MPFAFVRPGRVTSHINEQQAPCDLCLICKITVDNRRAVERKPWGVCPSGSFQVMRRRGEGLVFCPSGQFSATLIALEQWSPLEIVTTSVH